jgi:hypothetical protein
VYQSQKRRKREYWTWLGEFLSHLKIQRKGEINMSIWAKYHLIMYGVSAFSFIISIILLTLGLDIAAIAVFVIGVCVSQIQKNTIACPKCGTKLKVGHDLFSKYYTGYRTFLSKHCLNCDCNLDMDKYGNTGAERRR